MRDHYMPASLLAVGCLAVCVVGAFQMASEARPVQPTVHVEIQTQPVFATPEPTEDQPEPIVMPETVITAHQPTRDALSGPGKRCSQGAWFSSRPLVQGSGNVRGFCP